MVGLDIGIEAGSPLYLSVIFGQKSYGSMWVGRFRETLKRATGSDKLRAQQPPGHAPSRMRAPPPSPSGSIFGTSCRSFISAAAYAARHSIPEMIEGLGWLSRYVNDWTVDQDTGIIHIFGYRKAILDRDDVYLVMTVTKADVSPVTSG